MAVTTYSTECHFKGHPKASFDEKFGSRIGPIFAEDLP